MWAMSVLPVLAYGCRANRKTKDLYRRHRE